MKPHLAALAAVAIACAAVAASGAFPDATADARTENAADPACGDIVFVFTNTKSPHPDAVYKGGSCDPCARGCAEIAQDKLAHQDSDQATRTLLDAIACIDRCRRPR